MTDEEKCNCPASLAKGYLVCWRCGKPAHFDRKNEVEARYKDYLRLCELYGEQIALSLVYG